jgi:hypothetical protein
VSDFRSIFFFFSLLPSIPIQIADSGFI